MIGCDALSSALKTLILYLKISNIDKEKYSKNHENLIRISSRARN